MPKLDQLQIEAIHARYAATLTNPLPIEAFAPDGKPEDMDAIIYEHHAFGLDEQFVRIRLNQASSMDPAEPYDIGVANAIQLLAYLVTGTLPVFIPKPASTLITIDQLQSENDKLTVRIKKLERKLENANADLEKAVATKSLELLALETKHARELADAKKAGAAVAAAAAENNPAEDKPKKKSWLGKSK